MAAVTETSAPRRIETSLLVVQGFKDANGFEYVEGDRAPVSSRSVRQAALANPELFVMEFETAPVDLELLRRLDAEHDADYERMKAAKGTAEARREQALRKELKEQQRGDPKDLERRYAKQEREREEHEKKIREAREREKLEAELEGGKALLSGFHFEDH
jgi:hypothetical protein